MSVPVPIAMPTSRVPRSSCCRHKPGTRGPLKPSAQAGDKLDFTRISAGFPDMVCRASELSCPNDADVWRKLPSQRVPKAQPELNISQSCAELSRGIVFAVQVGLDPRF